MEQFDLLVRLPGCKLRYLPLCMGCLFALFIFCTSSAINFAGTPYTYSRGYFNIGGIYYAFTENFLSVPIGFIFGFLTGSVIRGFVRWKIITIARSAYAKMGPARTVSWNSESITLQSPVYETKVHWQMLDRIKIGYLGVYGLSGRRVVFAIPKDAFPAKVTIADLTQAWQSSTRQPLITK